MFKNVRNVHDLCVGHKFIDKKRRCIVECINGWQLGNLFEFADVDNKDITYCYTVGECRQNLLIYNLTDRELRSVLCMSMFEFIEMIIYDLRQKGEEKNGKENL